MNSPSPSPRVLIFPLPMQGHVNSMLQLAELVALSGVHVTFLNTEVNHARLFRHGDAARFEGYPGFEFRTIPDGLPEDHPRSADQTGDLFRSIFENGLPLLKQLLLSGALGSPTCIIADGIFGGSLVDVGNDLGIPVVAFRTGSACYFWTCFSIPDIIRAGDLPITTGDEDRDRLVTSVPGMESFLRRRDLPWFGNISGSEESLLEHMAQMTIQSCRASALILNTFEDLEAHMTSYIRAHCNAKVYTIGPLHAHLKERMILKKDEAGQSRNNRYSNSLFEVDKECLAWLDSQPPRSVVYVSFGSIIVMTRVQLMEFWHGLVNSKKRFLWVIKADSLAHQEVCEEQVPHELSEATKERGFIAKWVPQEDVLAHASVGGFLTHSGWNSTLESIVAGVPMICWPRFADQQINSRYVDEVWKLGIDIKDVCDRKVVEKAVNDLIVERRDEFASTTAEMARLAKQSVSEGGSSYCNFNDLIEDIKFKRM